MLVVKLTSELVEHQRQLTAQFAAGDPDDEEVLSPLACLCAHPPLAPSADGACSWCARPTGQSSELLRRRGERLLHVGVCGSAAHGSG